MAKLTRVPLRPFAGSALESEVSQFGSVIEGSKLHTLNIETIQALDSWLSGFSKALISGNRYPSMQEMNGVLKVLSYEQAYALQEGIPEYDSATTYYIGSIVKKTGTFELYGSLTNDNVGNALTVGTDWKLLCDLNSIIFANEDLNNITNIAINNIINAISPNYTAGVIKTWNTLYTVTSPGWVNIYGVTGQDEIALLVNGIKVLANAALSTQDTVTIAGQVMVKMGDTYIGTGTASTITFYPIIGV